MAAQSLLNTGSPCQGKKSRSERSKFNPRCYICGVSLQNIPPQQSGQGTFPQLTPERWWLVAAAPCNAASGCQNPRAPRKAAPWDLPPPESHQYPPSNGSMLQVEGARKSWQNNGAAIGLRTIRWRWSEVLPSHLLLCCSESSPQLSNVKPPTGLAGTTSGPPSWAPQSHFQTCHGDQRDRDRAAGTLPHHRACLQP